MRSGIVHLAAKVTLVLLAISTQFVTGQDAAPAGSGGSAIALSRYFFASPAEEQKARARLSTALGKLASFKGQLNSGPRLLAALKTDDEVSKLFYRHWAYLRLRCSLDRRDSACADAGRISAGFSEGRAFLQPALLAISPRQFAAFSSAAPELVKYRYALDSIRQAAGHTLMTSQERVIGQLSPALVDWQYPLYSDTVAGISFGTVQTSSGPIDVNRQRNLIAASPDQRVREEGFRKRLDGYRSARDVIAIALIRTAAAQTALAQVYGYHSAPDRKYESLGFHSQQTRELLGRVAERATVVQRYQKIRSKDIEQQYSTPAGPWDMSAPDPRLPLPRFSLEQARAYFHQAFAALGPEYQREFDSLISDEAQLADILPGGAPNRYAGGFSVGFPGTTSALFVGRFDGTFKDLSVIAHEGGHAVHSTLMSQHGVLPIYARGPAFLFESFAVFNELLFADYMANATQDRALQRYYREQWLNIKGLDAFFGAQDALLEQTVYDRVSQRTIRGANDLDEVSHEIDRHFSIFADTTPELRARWTTVSLAYEDPLYSINYVYGGLLALKYFQLWKTDPQRFLPGYMALLKGGFDASPAILLRRHLNIDLDDPRLLEDGVSLIQSRLQQLEDEQ